jgi:hypothetical protein
LITVKRAFIFFVFVFNNPSFSLQSKIALNSPLLICSYYGEEVNTEIKTITTVNETENIIKNILSIVGLKPNFEIRAANIPDAAAVIFNNKRYVLYNPEFVSRIDKSAGSNWRSISILAHEKGHHLNGHTLKVADNNIYIAAIMAQSNKEKYIAMFYDKHYNYLYITSAGTIISGAGRKIGTIKKHA